MTQEQTQMTDVDEDLANELLAFDEFVEDQTTTAIIEEVKMSGDKILVKATLPWNETVRRFFPHPKNDPGGEFQQLLAGIGLEMNAVKNLSEEEVPCEYDGDEWTIAIPERWTVRVREKVEDTVDRWGPENDLSIGAVAMIMAIVTGWAILAPVINILIWLDFVRWEGSEYGDGDVGLVAFVGAIVMVFVDLIWVLGFTVGYPYLIEGIRMVGALI